VTSICSFVTQGLAFIALPFLFQTVMGRSQVTTGFLITPWPAGMLGGFGLILCVGMAALAVLPANPSDTTIALSMTLCGIGFGFFQSPNLRALIASAPPGRSGGSSGILATARPLGQTAGAALVVLCLNISPEIGPVTALWLGSIFAALGSVASFLRLAARKA
jgi:DHA2 family multidrug resistance protein-like MFS transporter